MAVRLPKPAVRVFECCDEISIPGTGQYPKGDECTAPMQNILNQNLRHGVANEPTFGICFFTHYTSFYVGRQRQYGLYLPRVLVSDPKEWQVRKERHFDASG